MNPDDTDLKLVHGISCGAPNKCFIIIIISCFPQYAYMIGFRFRSCMNMRRFFTPSPTFSRLIRNKNLDIRQQKSKEMMMYGRYSWQHKCEKLTRHLTLFSTAITHHKPHTILVRLLSRIEHAEPFKLYCFLMLEYNSVNRYWRRHETGHKRSAQQIIETLVSSDFWTKHAYPDEEALTACVVRLV